MKSKFTILIASVSLFFAQYFCQPSFAIESQAIVVGEQVFLKPIPPVELLRTKLAFVPRLFIAALKLMTPQAAHPRVFLAAQVARKDLSFARVVRAR